MPTPHNKANPGAIAPTVLMPGDPLRAKFIAETFLQQAVLFNDVRGMLGYTGLYQGVPVSVMGSGMGMPSMGIYSYELYTQYAVQRIIRIGSAGSYTKDAQIYDVLLATGAYSESSYAKTMSGYEGDTVQASWPLNERLLASAKKLGIAVRQGVVHSSDVFYRTGGDTAYWQRLHSEKGCLGVEMESFALFHNAAVLGRQAACLLTVSDSFVTKQETTAQQRQTSFTSMMEIALQAAVL